MRVTLARLKGAAVATVVVLGASTAAASDATATESVPAQQGAPPKPGGVALTWTPTYMADAHDYTQDEAIAVAQKHDLVAGMPIAFKDHVAAMRAANPDLTLISYLNGTLVKASAVSTLPESAFAHDVDGRRITSKIWGTTLMAPTSPAWRQAMDQECRARVAESGYDGCLLDSMGLGVFATSQNFTGVPVNPATGAVYTQVDYRDALMGLAQYVRNASPDLVHVANCVENDWRYWKDAVTSRPLALDQPAVQMEDFLRGASTSVTGFPNADKWLRNVEVIRDVESHNVTGLFSTKLWVSHTDAQAAQWQAYAMASFLMGADGNSYLAFTRSRDEAGATGANAPYAMPKDIGTPSGPMVQAGSGAYTRTFSNGMAIVNPGTTSVTVNLPSPMRRLNGTTVTSVQLPPTSGEVLVGAVAAESAPPTGAFTGSSGAGALSVSGTASDDVSVKKVSLVVKRISDGQWLQADGTWAATWAKVAATLAGPGAASTTWSYSKVVSAGSYGLTLIVEDSAGKLNATPRPYLKVIVQ